MYTCAIMTPTKRKTTTEEAAMETLVIESLKAYAQVEGISMEEARKLAQTCEHAQEIIFKLACAAAAAINA